MAHRLNLVAKGFAYRRVHRRDGEVFGISHAQRGEIARHRHRELERIDGVGQRIAVIGFMAPPLKAESNFFVLTKKPMAVCPFCEKEADWPDDILAIYAKRVVDVVPFNVRILVKGRLELGPMTDRDTGFVSRVRLIDAVFARH